MIQPAIDAAIAEITAIVSAKTGKPASLIYEFTHNYAGSLARIYVSSPEYLTLSGYNCKGIDEALAQALAKANGLRTIEDENRDLGLPIREEVA